MSRGEGVSERFHRRWKVYTAVLLIAVVSTAIFAYVYYSMSVASVTSVIIDEVFADRNFVSGTYPNRNATYFIEIQVWSKAEALSIRLDNPVFEVSLSPLVEGNQSLPGGTILPSSYLIYNLRLTVNESRDIGTVSFPNATVFVQMTTRAETTLFSQTVTVRDSALWDWNTATLIKNYG